MTSSVWGLRVFNMVSGSLITVFRVLNPREMVFNRGLKAFSKAFNKNFRVFSGVVRLFISFWGLSHSFQGLVKFNQTFEENRAIVRFVKLFEGCENWRFKT